jgi:hypothetical protein
MWRCLLISKVDDIINQIGHLTDEECEKVLEHLRDRLNQSNAIILGKSYSWWDNEEDDVYNEQ